MLKFARVVFYICRKENITNTPNKLSGGESISFSWLISFLFHFFST